MSTTRGGIVARNSSDMSTLRLSKHSYKISVSTGPRPSPPPLLLTSFVKGPLVTWTLLTFPTQWFFLKTGQGRDKVSSDASNHSFFVKRAVTPFVWDFDLVTPFVVTPFIEAKSSEIRLSRLGYFVTPFVSDFHLVTPFAVTPFPKGPKKLCILLCG